MDKNFTDLVIQELRTLGENIAGLDRKVDIKLDILKKENSDNKKCNDIAHCNINQKLDDHLNLHFQHDQDHVNCKIDCNNGLKEKVDFRIFKWIVGSLAVVFSAVTITYGTMGLELKEKISRNIYFTEFAEYIYYELAGEKLPDTTRETLLRAKKNFKKHIEENNKENEKEEE